jgi:hypothetical protein
VFDRLERSSRPCHFQIPVAGLFISARSDSEMAAGESVAQEARGVAAGVYLTHRQPRRGLMLSSRALRIASSQTDAMSRPSVALPSRCGPMRPIAHDVSGSPDLWTS